MTSDGPKLTPCMECGKPVSTEAGKCPHPNCGTDWPNGVLCHICWKPARASTAVESALYNWENLEPIPFGTKPMGEYKFRSSKTEEGYHQDCYQAIIGLLKTNCRCCAQPIPLRGLFRPCPNCGDSRPIGYPEKCGCCSLPIEDENVTIETSEGTFKAHPLCSENHVAYLLGHEPMPPTKVKVDKPEKRIVTRADAWILLFLSIGFLFLGFWVMLK